jgi:phosphatidylinositol alpha-mannosyltransferase
MKLGIVCPYSFDAPGGVQFHVRDLAAYLIAAGHQVSVLAPADDDTPVPDFVQPAGRALAVPYNGSVARLAFGPVASARVRRWLAEGGFDLVHLHEPQIPSLSLIALIACDQPLVATFHTSIVRSRALQVVYPLLRPGLEKLLARIAVSEDARRTVVEHLGGDAVVIPNGVDVAAFRVPPDPRWVGEAGRPSVVFLGRIDEPRKGLSVLAAAFPAIRAAHPGVRLLVAGRGDTDSAAERFGAHRVAVEFLGEIDDTDKAALLAAADVYVAPQTGGESFGIVLVEAMSAGAAVVASDLPAFARVLDDGQCGRLFDTGDADALAAAVTGVLGDPAGREALVRHGRARVARYDWSTVAEQVLTLYDVALAQAGAGSSTTGGEPSGGHR